jgi:integrase
VAITQALAGCLARLYELEIVERGRDASGYVFVGRDGASPVCSTWPLTTVRRIQERAGVVTLNDEGETRAKRTFHEHRHTAATVMLTARKPLPVVARQLGHASSEITARVYEHLLDDALLDDALEAFERPRVARDVAREGTSSDKAAETRM